MSEWLRTNGTTSRRDWRLALSCLRVLHELRAWGEVMMLGFALGFFAGVLLTGGGLLLIIWMVDP